jgi:hypothetical protein
VRSFAACRACAEVLRDFVAQVVLVGLDGLAEDATQDRRAVAFEGGRRGLRSWYSRSALCQAGGEPPSRKARVRCPATLVLLTRSSDFGAPLVRRLVNL